ncbi:MAG: glycosyltransferase [Acidobacteriota bacterium]
MMEQTTAKLGSHNGLLIVTPIFNDWEAFELLLDALDASLQADNLEVDILAIDDGSSRPFCGLKQINRFKAIRHLEILELARNLGHQRAIAVGLAYVEANKPCEAVIVMDSDGEDDPKEVPRLVQAYKRQAESKVIFALRTRRSESRTFRIFYVLYKGIYYLLSGSKVRVGNFSIIPCAMLKRLVVVSEIWNHYAAGILKAKIPYAEIPTARGRRLAGRSRMNFVSLVMHGLGAISVHGDIIGVRALLATLGLITISIVAIAIVIIIRTATTYAIPGWASTLVTSFFIILMQAVMIVLLFAFMILNGRSNLGFLPRRDYSHFVIGLKKIFPKP